MKPHDDAILDGTMISSAGDLAPAREEDLPILAEVDWEGGTKRFWNPIPGFRGKVVRILREVGAKLMDD